VPNSTASIQACYTNNLVLFQIGNWLDIAYRVIVPSVLMTLNSIMFLNSIHNLNSRISQTFGTDRKLKKLILRIISLIILSISYIIFSLPVSVVAFYYTLIDVEFLAAYYIRYLIYSINFYIFFSTNSLFRREFLNFF
jgi:hypothetical protein